MKKLEKECNVDKELIKAIETPNIQEMMTKYHKMVRHWAAVVNLKLTDKDIGCPITFSNEVSIITEYLSVINEYGEFVNFCALLQGIIEDE